MIEFKNVYLQYVSEFYSLYDFTCVIKNHTLFVGDFFNGTTAIMRILSKIDKNYNGEVFFDNINLKTIKDKDLNLAYIPQQPVLFKNKNIFENLYYPLKIRKINKNLVKNLIFSIFLELKNNNFNFLDNYLNSKHVKLNNKINSNNEDFLNKQVKNILKLKVKKLTLSEQKIITLLRTLLRAPKYVLLENFFKDLDKEHIGLVKFLLNKIKESSTIIACEKDEVDFKTLGSFEIINLSSEEKKEN